MSGQRAVAYSYAERLRDDIYAPFPDEPDGPGPNKGWHIWRTARLRFGDFDAVLADNSTDDNLPRPWPYALVLGAFSRGAALLRASSPSPDAARAELAKLQAAEP